VSGLPRGWSGPPPAGPPPISPPPISPPPIGPPAAAPTPSPAVPGPPPAAGVPAGPVDLRPLHFTDVLDGAFAIVRSSLRTVVPLVLAVMVPLQLLSAFLQRDALRIGLAGVLDDPAAAEVLFGGGLASAGAVAAVLAQLAVAPLLAGALAAVAIARAAGRDTTVGQAARATLRRAGWLVGAAVLGLALRAAPLLLGALGAAVGADALLAVGAVLTVPAAIALTPLVAVITPALMAEDRPGVEAVAHAVGLARRAWGRVAATVLGTSAVFGLVAMLLAGVPSVLALLDDLGFAWVLVAIGNTISQLVTAPLTAAAMVLLHIDLRVRQEGLDFDVLLARSRTPAR
jgi:hypothetical protein